MPHSRRELLGILGSSSAIGFGSGSAGANSDERVIVHPQTGLAGSLLDNLIVDVGGSVQYTYDNFPFLAATIPSDRRTELANDTRIIRIDDDEDVGVPSDWVPSIPDLLDPGGTDDCDAHPDQQASWGWDRIGGDAVDRTGEGVGIGILDTGIETDHCSLSVAGGYNATSSLSPNDYEDRHGHGTHVAGIAGARDNDLGVIGIASEADLYAVKVLDDNGNGTHSTAIAGIDWCLSEGIPVISMSLGGDASTEAFDTAIEEAHAAGHLLVCAAGNAGHDDPDSCVDSTMAYPATHPDVIAVTAMNEDDSLASFSSIGPAVTLLAPGTDIESAYVDNRYATADGTSAACPFVSGVAALVWDALDDTDPGPNEPVWNALAAGAESVLGTCAEGDGLVSAPAAVAASTGEPSDDGSSAIDDSDPPANDTDDEPLGAVTDELPTEELPWWVVPGAGAGVAGIGYGLWRRRTGTDASTQRSRDP